MSYPPYIFEVCLFDEVEDTKSKATFGNGVLKFQLVKKSPLQWNQLLASESEDKEFMKNKREEAVGKAHKRAEEEKERKAAEKREQEKLALREQMKVGPKIKRSVKAYATILKGIMSSTSSPLFDRHSWCLRAKVRETTNVRIIHDFSLTYIQLKYC